LIDFFHLYCRLGGEPTGEPTRDDLMVDKSGAKTSYYSSRGALVAVAAVTTVATAVVAAIVAAAITIAATAAVVDCYVFVTPSLDIDDPVISSPPRSISMTPVVGSVTHGPINAHR
jgi:hypothetical protein